MSLLDTSSNENTSSKESDIKLMEFEEEIDGKTYPAEFYQTERGNYLCVNGFFFLRNTVSQNTISWRCTCYRSQKCKARAKVEMSQPESAVLGNAHHSHGREDQKAIRRQKLVKKSLAWKKSIDMNNPMLE